MSEELKIDAKELREYSKEKLSKLIEYIKDKLKYDVVEDGGSITLKGDNIDKKYIKTLIKRFLYVERVVNDFRVLVKGGSLLLKERRQVKIKELHY